MAKGDNGKFDGNGLEPVTAETEIVAFTEPSELAAEASSLMEGEVRAFRAAPQPEAQPEGGIFRRSFAQFGATLREAARVGDLKRTPYGLRPAIMLGLTFFATSFSGAIFGIALPFIVRDRGINALGIILTISLIGFFLIFALIAIAFSLDRLPRVPVFAGFTVMTGLFGLGTSMSGGAFSIGATRAGDALSDSALGVPIFSLEADYYPVEVRGRMFAFVGTLSRLGRATAPVAIGYLIAATSWRVPFALFGSLVALLGIAAFFLMKEPVRGFMERKALGMSDEEASIPEPAPSFAEAWRTIWGINTLRRLFISGIFGGIADRLPGLFLVLWLVQKYHMNAIAIGWLIFAGGAAGLFGGILGGGIVDVLMRKRPQRVLIFSASFSLVGAFIYLAEVSGAPIVYIYIFAAITGFFLALLGPARGVFFAQVIPANMRTLGLSVFLLGDIPSVIVFTTIAARLPTWGIQGVLVAAFPFYLISAFIDFSAAGLFDRDARNALHSQAASVEYRAAKVAGRLKLLVCRGVEVEYSGVQVLFGVDFDVEQGEIVALLGSNGAGKSTLLKAISGTREASGGAVVLDGRDITHVPPYEIAKAGIVLMPGGKGVFPGLSVHENLSLGTWNLPEEERVSAVEDVLETFPALRAREKARAGSLSGGEQQMLALGMALLAKPRLLLIDELSLGLAPTVVSELLEGVRKMRESGITIVLVEQSVNVALTVAERAIFMEKGEVRFQGKTADLLKRPDIVRAVYVKGTAAVGGPRDARRSPDWLQTATPVLSIENVTVQFGGVRALNDVSFDARSGEILGIIGPNGAGKTTLFDVISGFVPSQEGRIVLEGEDLSSLPPDARARKGLLRRFQDARLYPSLTVHETLLVALDRHHKAKNMLLTAIQLPRVRASERELRKRADELIELLGLGNARDKFVRELSTGMRRITDLACVMAAEPRVLLLDEPASGVAQAEAEALAPLLRRVRAETGCTMLLIEHDMPLVTRAADELIAMVQGAVVIRGQADEVLANEIVVQSYLGTSEEAIKRSGALV